MVQRVVSMPLCLQAHRLPASSGRTLSFVSPLGKVLSLPSPLSGLYSLRRKGTTVVRVARVLKRDCFD